MQISGELIIFIRKCNSLNCKICSANYITIRPSILTVLPGETAKIAVLGIILMVPKLKAKPDGEQKFLKLLVIVNRFCLALVQ